MTPFTCAARPQFQFHVTANGSGVTPWSLTRDDNGKIVSKTEAIDGVTSNYVHTFDAMGRLLTVTKDGTLVEEGPLFNITMFIKYYSRFT